MAGDHRGTGLVERGLMRSADMRREKVFERLRAFGKTYAVMEGSGAELRVAIADAYGVDDWAGARYERDRAVFAEWFWPIIARAAEQASTQMRSMHKALLASYFTTGDALAQNNETTRHLDSLALGIVALLIAQDKKFPEIKSSNWKTFFAVLSLNVLGARAARAEGEKAVGELNAVRNALLADHPIYAGIEKLIATGAIDRAGFIASLSGSDLVDVRRTTMTAAIKAINFFEEGAKAFETQREAIVSGKRANWGPFEQLIDNVICSLFPKGSADEDLRVVAKKVKAQRIDVSAAKVFAALSAIIGITFLVIGTGGVAAIVLTTAGIVEGATGVASIVLAVEEQKTAEVLDRAALVDATLKATSVDSGDLTFDVVLAVAGLVFALAGAARGAAKAAKGAGAAGDTVKDGGRIVGAGDDAAKKGADSVDDAAKQSADAAVPAKPGNPVPEPPVPPDKPPVKIDPQPPAPLHEQPGFKADVAAQRAGPPVDSPKDWDAAVKRAGPSAAGESTRQAVPPKRRTRAQVQARKAEEAAKPSERPARGGDAANPDQDLAEVMAEEKGRGVGGDGVPAEAGELPEGLDRRVDRKNLAKERSTTYVDENGVQRAGETVPVARQPYDDTLTSPNPATALADALEAKGMPRPPGHQPHHIVPAGHPGAEEARAILERAGIGLDEAENGMWLPTGSGTANVDGVVRHEFTYSKNYIDWATEQLQTYGAERGLGRIKTTLSRGETPWAPAGVKPE